MNKTLLEKVGCMLSNANLSKNDWGEIVHTTYYLVNRSPSIALEFRTPQEVGNNKPLDYNHLSTFGCFAYCHSNEGKLEPNANKGMFMSYPDGTKGYRI